MEPMNFPGGYYKYSNIQNFPGSAKMSGNLITLYPGGLRELHWHTEIEWAIVLNGTCRYLSVLCFLHVSLSLV